MKAFGHILGSNTKSAAVTVSHCDELSESVRDLLRVSGVLDYVGKSSSTDAKIAIEIYENERFQPILQSWGNITGIHMNAFDRSPYTGKDGRKPLR